MKIDVFNKVVKEQLLVCEHLLTGKGHEYAPDAVDESNIDRLAHFKKAAAIIDGTPKEALLGMLTKHLVSISDMCTDGRSYSLDRWTEKITDSITVGFSHTNPTESFKKTLEDNGFVLEVPFARVMPEEKAKAEREKPHRYVCPVCGQEVKTTADLSLICGICEVAMERAD